MLARLKYYVGIYIILFRNLKSKTKRDCLLRSSYDGQFNDCSMLISYIISVAPPPCLFNANLSAQCCNISSLWMDVCNVGMDPIATVEQYSIDGKKICL